MAAYSPDQRSKGVRLAKRTTYDQDLIHGIVNSTPILHVSFNAPTQDGPQFPTILPMLGSVATYPTDTDAHLYLHGSSVARLFRLTTGNETPLCIAATLLDGYVLALAPFHNSCNYRSAVVFGYGSILEDAEETQWALREITNGSVPHRWENSRHPASKAEVNATGVLKVRIETASAKVRQGGPSDDRADMTDEKLVRSTWTGVVPAYTVLGEPVAGEANRVARVPEYLADWVADANSMAEQNAVDAIGN